MPTYRNDRQRLRFPERCRSLRREATEAERKLWEILRARRLHGFKFRRQHEFGRYILDFFCPEIGLVVEADGAQHFLPEGQERDRTRDRTLAAHGLRVLRFTDRQILLEPESVEAEIERLLVQTPSP